MGRRRKTEQEKRLEAAKKAADKHIKKGFLKKENKDAYIRGYCREPSKT